MPTTTKSKLVQDLNPLRDEIAGRLKQADVQIAGLTKQAREIEQAIRQAQNDRKVLANLARVAGNGARPRRATKGRGKAGSTKRGARERETQALKAIATGGGKVTKQELVRSLSVSEVRVQQILTALRKGGQIKSAPKPGGRRTLVWSATAAGKRAL